MCDEKCVIKVCDEKCVMQNVFLTGIPFGMVRRPYNSKQSQYLKDEGLFWLQLFIKDSHASVLIALLYINTS